MLRTRHLLPVLGSVLMLMALAACGETASNVGLGLVEEGSQPVVREVTPTLFEATPLNDVTGAVPRVLAGKVNDPLVGTIAATGYVDFRGGFDTTVTSPLTSVTLRLVRDYVYGDTLAPVTLNLLDITEGWESLGRKADTTLSVGGLITAFTFAPTDSLVTVPLPEAWINDNLATLRSADFDTLFHGFALEAVTTEAVAGFDFSGSDLRLITETDTIAYEMSRTISGIVRETEPVLPDGVVLLQDGVGPSIQFDFDLSDFGETPLNGVVLRFFADTAAVQNAPPNFHRPFLQTLQLIQIIDPDPASPAVFIAEVELSEDGDYRFSGGSLGSFFQETFFGLETFEHLELRTPILDNTINFVLIHDAASGEKAPEALFTISP